MIEPATVSPRAFPVVPSSAGLRTSRLMLVLGTVLAVVLVLACAVGLWRLRTETLIDAHRNLDRLARALAEQTERSFQGIDLVIKQARSEINRLKDSGDGGTEGQDTESMHRLLQTNIFGLPQGQALLLFDATGTMLAHSREFPTPKVNAVDRDYFITQKSMARDDLFISEPMQNRVNGRWMISLSRHYRGGTAGEFGGVVMAAVEIDYFAHLYQDLQLPPGVSIVLQRLDGCLLVRYPEPGPPGSRSPLGALGTVLPPSTLPLAGVATLVAVSRVSSLPLAISLLLPEPVTLVVWRQLAIAIASGTAAAVAAILALIVSLALHVARLEQREAARAGLAAIVESSRDAIIGTDLNNLITAWNRSAEDIYGYRTDEAIGRSGDMLAPPESRAETRVLTRRVQQGEAVTRYEAVRIRKDGRPIEVSLTLSPIRNSRGTIVGLSTIARDITESKRIETEIARYRDHLAALVSERTAALTESNRQLAIARDQAEAANQAKSIFLANMSHEIRTPMNAILGFTQIMQRSPSLPPEEREHLEIIDRSSRNLLALINDILEMSKVEAGRSDVQCTTFDLDDLLGDLHLMFKLAAERKGLHWEVDRAPGLSRTIVTDEGKLRQILINLIGNAVKFTQTGGVTLRAWANGSKDDKFRLRIEVEDTGPGITITEQTRLFEAFEQTSIGAARCGGTGLGLAISRRFARLIGGDITVASQPGNGTRFHLDLPVTRGCGDDLRHPQPRRRVVGLKPGQGEVRILVADDKNDNRLFLYRLLEPLGFALREARDGQEAMGVWETWHPHIILMDVVMPVMDGHEATRRIRAMPGGRDVKILALSASAFDEDREAVLATGADDFLRKPVTAEELLSAIGRRLGLDYEVVEEAISGSDPRYPQLPPNLGEKIPQDLLERMRETVFRSDDVGLAALIGELPPELSDLATSLRHLLGRFDWDALDDLLGSGVRRTDDA